MAVQKALTPETAQIIILEPSSVIRGHDGEIKVHEMAVVQRMALQQTHAVWVMAHGAWSAFFHDMLPMDKALIIKQDRATVAIVAQGIAGR